MKHVNEANTKLVKINRFTVFCDYLHYLFDRSKAVS